MTFHDTYAMRQTTTTTVKSHTAWMKSNISEINKFQSKQMICDFRIQAAHSKIRILSPEQTVTQ